jgi:hypothetical protein
MGVELHLSIRASEYTKIVAAIPLEVIFPTVRI